MEYTNLMVLVANDGATPVTTLCRETFVACRVNVTTNELNVILHHQINANPCDYGDHVYKVDLDLNLKLYQSFRHWEPCPLHEFANTAHILIQRS